MQRTANPSTSTSRTSAAARATASDLLASAKATASGAQTTNGGAANNGTKDGVQIGADGTVTIKSPANLPEIDAAIKLLKESGNFLVVKISNADFGQDVRELIVSYEEGDNPKMIDSLGSVIDEVILKAGATETDPDEAGNAAQYKDLPPASASAAAGVKAYPLETNNAHADPDFLIKGGQTLTGLLALVQMFTTASGRIGLTTAPLSRQLAESVTAVCDAVESELPRNSGLKRILGPALDYLNQKVIKGQQTKKKIKAVKDKLTAGAPGNSTPPSGGQAGGGNGLK
jgi:hypothetical protein